MAIEDQQERFFYETECIKETWSVRELKHQIVTNLYIRAGISKNPEKLLQQKNENNDSLALSILIV